MDALPRAVADWLHDLVLNERAVAYLKIDPQTLVAQAGGHLEHYALSALRIGEPVTERLVFMEGLLEFLDLPFEMPMIELPCGRVADVHLVDGEDGIWLILLDATAERDNKQRIQQKAYEMTLLQERERQLNQKLQATNDALRKSQAELERSQAALLKAHEQIQQELNDAAAYVRSLLPAPMEEPFVAEWLFVPSIQLGGDAFGYHWMDPDHFALYLLDVCGHGVGPSLLSIAVLHLLQSASLRNVDFRRPAEVLQALNELYQMENSDDLYFTMWYGVYQPNEGALKFACAGHPPAVLLETETGAAQMLKAPGLPVGLMPTAGYRDEVVTVRGGQSLYLFSDGAYEVERPNGTMMTIEDLVSKMRALQQRSASELQEIYQYLLAERRMDTLEDDFSMVRLTFAAA